MPYVPPTFPYEKRTWYPHMKPNDEAIWNRFLSEFPNAYDSVQYSVPCGRGAEFDTLITEETGAHDEYLYKRKIDAVGFKDDTVTIIELKPNAGSSAIGQVKMYRDLYIKDYSPVRFPNMLIITDRFDDDVAEFAAREGIQLIAV